MSDRPRYRIEIAPAAQREFRRIALSDQARLRAPMLALGLDPRPPGATKLVGSDLWRLRAGDARVVYLVDDRRRLVVILRVARRGGRTYRRVR